MGCSSCSRRTPPGGSARRHALDIQRLVDPREDEATQIPDVPVAVSGVERSRAAIRLRHEQDEMPAARSARSTFRAREERRARALRGGFVGERLLCGDERISRGRHVGFAAAGFLQKRGGVLHDTQAHVQLFDK